MGSQERSPEEHLPAKQVERTTPQALKVQSDAIDLNTQAHINALQEDSHSPLDKLSQSAALKTHVQNYLHDHGQQLHYQGIMQAMEASIAVGSRSRFVEHVQQLPKEAKVAALWVYVESIYLSTQGTTGKKSAEGNFLDRSFDQLHQKLTQENAGAVTESCRHIVDATIDLARELNIPESDVLGVTGNYLGGAHIDFMVKGEENYYMLTQNGIVALPGDNVRSALQAFSQSQTNYTPLISFLKIQGKLQEVYLPSRVEMEKILHPGRQSFIYELANDSIPSAKDRFKVQLGENTQIQAEKVLPEVGSLLLDVQSTIQGNEDNLSIRLAFMQKSGLEWLGIDFRVKELSLGYLQNGTLDKNALGLLTQNIVLQARKKFVLSDQQEILLQSQLNILFRGQILQASKGNVQVNTDLQKSSLSGSMQNGVALTQYFSPEKDNKCTVYALAEHLTLGSSNEHDTIDVVQNIRGGVQFTQQIASSELVVDAGVNYTGAEAQVSAKTSLEIVQGTKVSAEFLHIIPTATQNLGQYSEGRIALTTPIGDTGAQVYVDGTARSYHTDKPDDLQTSGNIGVEWKF